MDRIITALFALAVLSATAVRAADLSPDQAEEVKLKSSKWMELRNKADALQKQSKYADAEAILKQIVAERQAYDLDLLSEYDDLGSLYTLWNKQAEAVQIYKDMVDNREKLNGPDDLQVVYPLQQYAASLRKFGKTEECAALLRRAAAIQKDADTIPKFGPITMAPGSPERIIEAQKMEAMGERMLRCELQPKAGAYFERAVQLDPNNAKALRGRGEVADWNNHFQKAGVDFDKAIKLDPKYKKAYVDRAWMHFNLHQYQAAIADFDKAIALDPTDMEIQGDRAKQLDNLGKHKEAIEGYSRVIAANPALFWPYIQRSTVYSATGQHKLAIADLTTIVERAPADTEWLDYRADAFMKAGDWQSAQSDYSKIIQLNPKSPLWYHKRAVAFAKLDGKKTPRVLADDAMAKKLGY